MEKKGRKNMNKQRNILRGILTACVIAWMIVIFCFSAQPDVESSEISGSVSYRIVECFNHISHKNMTQTEMQMQAKRIEYPVRKLAHMSEYGILSLLFFAMYFSYSKKAYSRKKLKSLALFSLLSTAAYAGTDEFHQLFVPGRAGRVTDVLIDSGGAVIALLFAGILVAIINKNIYNRNTVR